MSNSTETDHKAALAWVDEAVDESLAMEAANSATTPTEQKSEELALVVTEPLTVRLPSPAVEATGVTEVTAEQLAKEAHEIISHQAHYERTKRFKELTPYNIDETNVVRGVPKFVYRNSFGKGLRRHASREPSKKYFLRLVLTLFREFGVACTYISSHKLANTLEAHGHKVSHASVAKWLEMLCERGLLSVDRSEFEGQSGGRSPIPSKRRAFVYSVKCPRLKSWIAKERKQTLASSDLKASIPQLAFRIAQLPESERAAAIANIPGLDQINDYGCSFGQTLENQVNWLSRQATSFTDDGAAVFEKRRERTLYGYVVADPETERLLIKGKGGTRVTVKDQKILQVGTGDGYGAAGNELGDLEHISTDYSILLEVEAERRAEKARIKATKNLPQNDAELFL